MTLEVFLQWKTRRSRTRRPRLSRSARPPEEGSVHGRGCAETRPRARRAPRLTTSVQGAPQAQEARREEERNESPRRPPPPQSQGGGRYGYSEFDHSGISELENNRPKDEDESDYSDDDEGGEQMDEKQPKAISAPHRRGRRRLRLRRRRRRRATMTSWQTKESRQRLRPQEARRHRVRGGERADKNDKTPTPSRIFSAPIRRRLTVPATSRNRQTGALPRRRQRRRQRRLRSSTRWLPRRPRRRPGRPRRRPRRRRSAPPEGREGEEVGQEAEG